MLAALGFAGVPGVSPRALALEGIWLAYTEKEEETPRRESGGGAAGGEGRGEARPEMGRQVRPEVREGERNGVYREVRAVIT